MSQNTGPGFAFLISTFLPGGDHAVGYSTLHFFPLKMDVGLSVICFTPVALLIVFVWICAR